jgi:hypothetical protein
MLGDTARAGEPCGGQVIKPMFGHGAYYVAFFPRKRSMPVPTFQTLGGGTIIKTHGEFGTDYGFLSAQEAAASGEAARFRGTAASVQDRQTASLTVKNSDGKPLAIWQDAESGAALKAGPMQFQGRALKFIRISAAAR